MANVFGDILAGIGGIEQQLQALTPRNPFEAITAQLPQLPTALPQVTPAAPDPLQAAPKLPVVPVSAPSGDIRGIITSSAQKYNVDPNELLRIGEIESSLNPKAKNPTSSAGGLFQQIDSNAQQYGVANRFDPVQSADGAARFARDNKMYLESRLGRPLRPGELYLAHQQGPAGAAKLLTNPSARAVDVVGREAVKLNGGHEGMSAGDFAALWTNKASGSPSQKYVPTAHETERGVDTSLRQPAANSTAIAATPDLLPSNAGPKQVGAAPGSGGGGGGGYQQAGGLDGTSGGTYGDNSDELFGIARELMQRNRTMADQRRQMRLAKAKQSVMEAYGILRG